MPETPQPPREPGDSRRDDFFEILTNETPEHFELFGMRIPGVRELDPIEMQRVMSLAVGELNPICPRCGSFCSHKVLEYRDAFFERGRRLAERRLKLFDAYFAARALGVQNTTGINEHIFAEWSEDAYLYDALEPQNGFIEDTEVDGSQRDEFIDDDESDADDA